MYDIYLPAEVRGLIQQMRVAISLGIEGVPLACVGAEGYFHRLLFWVFTPLVLVGVAAFLILAYLRITSCIQGEQASWIKEVQSRLMEGTVARQEYRSRWVFSMKAIELLTPIMLRIVFLT